MRKYIMHVIDNSILVLCFLFIVSTFFKLISWTALNRTVYASATVLIIVWIIGVTLSLVFTRPLYQWILRLRHLEGK